LENVRAAVLSPEDACQTGDDFELLAVVQAGCHIDDLNGFMKYPG